MTLLAAHNQRRSGAPLCPCCLDCGGLEVRLEPAGPGIWTCAGCRGELGREPCGVVGSPNLLTCSPDGEHYHFTQPDGGVRDEPAIAA